MSVRISNCAMSHSERPYMPLSVLLSDSCATDASIVLSHRRDQRSISSGYVDGHAPRRDGTGWVRSRPPGVAHLRGTGHGDEHDHGLHRRFEREWWMLRQGPTHDSAGPSTASKIEHLDAATHAADCPRG